MYMIKIRYVLAIFISWFLKTEIIKLANNVLFLAKVEIYYIIVYSEWCYIYNMKSNNIAI